jgi:ribose-phosphate pyrophosphokinase
MILFSFPSHDYMAQGLLQLCALERGECAVHRFPNQELYITVKARVRGEHCVILGSITPPDEHVLSLLLLAHTLKKEGARRVTALLPYLAYSRHDKSKPGESLAVAWAGSLFRASGIDGVITADLHSQRDEHLLALPVTSLSTATLFAEQIKLHGLTDATLVAPDNGAIRRCCEVRAAAGMSGEIFHFEKERTLQGITHTGSKGDIRSTVVVVDDMLDTGGTLVSACEQLNEKGAREIYIMVTHGLFTGSQWERLWELRVKKIFCTDTIAIPTKVRARPIATLSVIPLLEPTLRQEVNDYAEQIR